MPEGYGIDKEATKKWLIHILDGMEDNVVFPTYTDFEETRTSEDYAEYRISITFNSLRKID